MMAAMRWLTFGVASLILLACGTTSTVVRDRAPAPGSKQEAAVANMNLGVGYLRQGRPDLAIERLQRALKQNPRLADAHSSIAIAYDQTGAFDEAEQHYTRATQREPAIASAANSYAVFLCRRSRWQDAEPYFERAADNPSYATPEVVLTNAGVCARGAGDNAKAEQYYRAALAKNPMFADALSGMAEIAYQQRNFLQARAFLQRYLAVQPATAPLLLMCVNIERQLENRDGAERCAMQLRQTFPAAPEIAQLQDQQGDGR
jgi:type IV pilus assembly protein PilF